MIGLQKEKNGRTIRNVDYSERSRELTEKNLESVGIYNHKIYEGDFIIWRLQK